jgi:uncharacterized membrane protein YqhA
MEIKLMSDRELIWSVVIHLVFVISSIAFAMMDRITSNTQR